MSWQEFMLPSFPTRASVNFPTVWIFKLTDGEGGEGGRGVKNLQDKIWHGCFPDVYVRDPKARPIAKGGISVISRLDLHPEHPSFA